MIDEIVAHAREDAPNECCGIIATDGDRAIKLFRTANAEASPLRFVIDSKDQLRVHRELDESGWEMGAIYHSHTRSAAYPSQTDVNFARSWPGVIWLIVSLEDADNPSVRVFSIEDDNVEELDLAIGEQ